MKKIILFSLCMALAVWAGAETNYHIDKQKYRWTVMDDGTERLLSNQAANAWIKDSSVKLVSDTTADGQVVWVLPQEKKTTPALRKDSVNNNLSQLENVMKQQASCGGNPACEDLLVLWKARGIKEAQIPALIRGASKDFAQELRQQKKLCYHICDWAVKQVEVTQTKRILGSKHNIKALDSFLFSQPEFTLAGWDNALHYLCQLGQKNPSLKGEIKKFAKKVEKQFDAKKLPIVSPSNVDPYAGIIGAGIACINRRL